MQNSGLDEAQAEIKIAGRNINNNRYADDTTLLAENRRTKEPLDESERRGRKGWFKTQHSKNSDHGIRSHSFMQIDGERMETVTDFIWGGAPKSLQMVTTHEIKRRLLLGRKAMVDLDRILKSRDITLLTSVCLIQAMVFPVVTYGCKSWIYRNLHTEELMVLNCTVGEDS